MEAFSKSLALIQKTDDKITYYDNFTSVIPVVAILFFLKAVWIYQVARQVWLLEFAVGLFFYQLRLFLMKIAALCDEKSRKVVEKGLGQNQMVKFKQLLRLTFVSTLAHLIAGITL